MRHSQNNEQDIILQYQKKEQDIFTNALQTMAKPTIKGEITKGKLRLRGIKILQVNDGLKTIKWLDQRGKQISPKIEIADTIVI
jgi:hypothetical protein